jgi:hypothetical protein
VTGKQTSSVVLYLYIRSCEADSNTFIRWRFSSKKRACRKMPFRINEIGKSRVVLRLYVVKGVVSLNTLVKAGYKHPLFNLVVVAQRNTRNTRKRKGHAEFPILSAGAFPACSDSSRPLRSYSARNSPARAAPLIFAISHCPRRWSQYEMKLGRFLGGGD